MMKLSDIILKNIVVRWADTGKRANGCSRRCDMWSIWMGIVVMAFAAGVMFGVVLERDRRARRAIERRRRIDAV